VVGLGGRGRGSGALWELPPAGDEEEDEKERSRQSWLSRHRCQNRRLHEQVEVARLLALASSSRRAAPC
jgi:hypothetical protein